MAITFSKGISLTDGIDATAGYLVPGGSVYIEGSSGQYINIPKTIANTSVLLGDHTIEFWYYQTQYNTTADVIWSNSAWYPAGSNINLKSKFLLTAGSSGNMVLSFGIPTYSTTTISFTAPTLNNWHHVAITRRNATFFIYVDGIYKGTNANNTDLLGPIGGMTLGDAVSGFDGYISNFRIVNNRQLYSGTSTSSATPNYQLPSQPLSVPAIATSTAGSTSSQISITTVAPLNNQAVTYEGWFYNANTELGGSITGGEVFSTATSVGGNSTGFYFAIGGSSTWNITGAGSIGFGGGGSYPPNRWQHFALVAYPSSGTMYIYLDGALMGAATFTAGSLTSTRIFLAGPTGRTSFAGLRYTIGATLYSGSTIPLPTAPPETQAGNSLGTGGSAQFNGTNGLSVVGSEATAIGSQDFTWECWVNTTSQASDQTFISQRAGGTGYWFGLNTGTLTPAVWNTAGQLLASTRNIGTSSWQHVALTRQSGVLTIFVNGVFGGRLANLEDSTAQAISVGRDTDNTKGLTGNISNVRVTVGQVLYTVTTTTAGANSFWPMTPANLVPFTAGANTQLLLTMSSSGALLTDSSANAFTVTNTGSVTYSSSNPFVWYTQLCMPMATSGTLLTDTSGSAGNTITGGTWSPIAPWAPQTQILLRASNSANALTDSSSNALALINNGQTSGYFNGTTQYLTLDNDVAFDFGANNTTNFTIEAWVHPATLTALSSGSAQTVFGTHPTTGTRNGYAFAYNASGFLIFSTHTAGVSTTITATNNALVANTWSHIAVTRSGSTYRLFVNGVQATTTGTISQSASTSGNPITVGGLNYTGVLQYVAGFLSNVRVTSGAALYTAGFTPSTTPLTTSPGSGTVILLLPLSATPFTDSSATAATVTNVGTTTLASSSPFSQTIVSATYNDLSPFVSPTPVMNLATAPATATAGTTWSDASGNGNDGTLTGTDAKMTRVSTHGGAIRFTASSSSPAYISTPFALATTSFTVSVIFSLQGLTGPTTAQGIWDNSSVTATQGYRGYVNRTDLNQFGVNIGSGNYFFYPSIPQSGTTLLTNVIYELTYVIAPDRMSAYVNGQLANTGQQNASLPAAGFAANTMLFGALRLSNGSAPTGNLGCTLYNMRVYDKALTVAQVRANYNQYRGNYGI